MQKALLIAEKPDLMRKIQAVYNKHEDEFSYTIDFLSQRGHLVTLKNPSELDEKLTKWSWDDLPIEPENYGGWQYKIIEETKTGKFETAKERFTKIKKALASGNYDFVIHAGDPDQEGELLVNIVLMSVKNKLPVMRFWTNDLTESQIVNALKNLKDDKKDPMLVNLLSAAFARQHSDWRFGMNISRASTLKMQIRVSCGRVKTVYLKLICQREDEIENFKPSTCYGVKALYKENFDGTLFNKDDIVTDDENASPDQKSGIIWVDTKKEAEDIIKQLNDTANVVAFQSKRVETFAPKLYKLATLQIDAGKRGYDDATSLATLQKLYEQEYVSYPRTSCEYLSSHEDFDGILGALSAISEYDDYIKDIDSSVIGKVRASKKWINDAALQESGHSALRPTTKVPDMSKLSKVEQDIYDMVVRRFIAIFLPPIVQDKTNLVTESNGHTFRSSGKTLIDAGFSTIFGTVFNDTLIPEHQNGDILAVEKYEITEKTTVCPTRYTSPDLIAVSENPAKFLNDKSLKSLGKKLKIGTPATRSQIIRQLIDVDKYLIEKKVKKTTYLMPSEIGRKIIRNLDDLQICRVDMTAQWEEDLELVRSGQKTLKELEAEMKAAVREMVQEIKDREMTVINEKQRNVVGQCPKCGRDILENEKGIFCTGFREGCRLSIFKSAYGQTFDAEDFMTLINGETVTKNNRIFYYDFDNAKLMEQTSESNMLCPVCSSRLQESPVRYSCKCGFATQKEIAGHKLTQEDFTKLAEDSITDKITDFVSSKGKPFEAQLKLNDNKLEFQFESIPSSDTGLKCPCCGKHHIMETEKSFRCECGFVIWKTIAQRNIGISEVEQIANNKETEKLDGFVSKAGKSFSCKLVLNKRKKAVVMDFDD